MAGGSTARTEWIAAPMRAPGESDGTESARAEARAAQAGGVGVGEAALRVVEIDADPALEVAGVEQGDPDPGVGGRRHQRRPHGVGIGVGDTARPVVEVVELAHRADPGQRHLGEGGPGELVVRVGIERRRDLVHLLPPRPEGTGPAVGAAAQRPVESMAVGVGQAGHGQAGQPDRRLRSFRSPPFRRR